MSDTLYTRQDLINLVPHHSSIVCIDSDGCVFDTMETKQKGFFHGEIVKVWGLEAIEPYLRETAEFVTLYSHWRGGNRFHALQRIFNFLRKRPEVREAGVTIPEFPDLNALIASGKPLGHPSIEETIAETGSEELKKFLQWSQNVNRLVSEEMGRIYPFSDVQRCLQKVQIHSDAIVVSQTQTPVIAEEWKENGIDEFVSVIAGAELGTKEEHITLATSEKYKKNNILMIGDSMVDREAARACKVCFYPINPAHEDQSWARFYDEAYDKFLEGTYKGSYENERIEEFEALLPETPPWA